MDLTSIIGLILAAALIVGAIAIAPGSSFSAFIDFPSAMVVIGGAIAAVMISFPLRSVLSVGSVTKNVFLL